MEDDVEFNTSDIEFEEAAKPHPRAGEKSIEAMMARRFDAWQRQGRNGNAKHNDNTNRSGFKRILIENVLKSAYCSHKNKQPNYSFTSN
jgi:hypothetical protein